MIFRYGKATACQCERAKATKDKRARDVDADSTPKQVDQFGRRPFLVACRNDGSSLPAALDVVPMPGGFKVVDAEQLLAYRYARQTRADADTAKVLTMDEALGSGHFFTV